MPVVFDCKQDSAGAYTSVEPKITDVDPFSEDNSEVSKTAEKYAKYYNEESFWNKCAKLVKKAGSGIVSKALQLYYALSNPTMPIKIKMTIYGALGYLILPIE